VRFPTAIAAALALLLPGGALAQSQVPDPTSGTTTTPTATAPTVPAAGVTPVMGQSRLTGEQIASWFTKQAIRPAIEIPIVDLARFFVEEGNAQDIRGDIAFAQSVLETGWFRYAGSMVKPGDNNYSGLGACDSCSRGNIFATPQEGVRAQIQHLWAYADPNASPTRTARPLADIRFTYVKPYGRAPTWEAMGDGNWATGGGYTEKILGLYAQMLRHNGLEPQVGKLRTVAAGTPAPTGRLKVIVTTRGAVRIGGMPARAGTVASALRTYGSGAGRRAAYGTCHMTWPALGAVMTFRPAAGATTCGDTSTFRAAVLTGPQWVTPSGIAPGDPVSKVRRLHGRKAATGSSAVLVRARNGARLSVRMREGVVKAVLVTAPRR
jgi:hypothetical protein